ncbi:MAG: N-acetylglucosamine-6-phosphate deacetylase [Psychromonas sp.]|nr:N-acetylglucosamine-6-phosphate deacetylase [Psychromonas sp.]
MSQLLIKNSNIVLENSLLTTSELLIENGKIVNIGANIVAPEATIIDAKGKTVLPGFIDVHVHGGVGFDFMDANVEGNCKVARYKASNGCTSFVATTLTGSKESLLNALTAVKEAQSIEHKGAEIIGVHMEGPFFNHGYKGAQNPVFMENPNIEDIKEYLAVKPGLLKMMSIAPEKEGALQAIEYMSKRNVTCSAGHTGATCVQVQAAVEKGLTHATHTFNGMSPLHHREPGVVGAVMLEDDIYAEAIFDCIHLDPQIVKLLVKVKGINKVILISDAMQAVGLEDGIYDLGGLTVNVEDGAARLLDGTLAGSCLTMQQAFQNAVEHLDLELWDISKIMSRNAAVQLGLNKGVIANGFDADFIFVDDKYNVTDTFVNGIQVYSKN